VRFGRAEPVEIKPDELAVTHLGKLDERELCEIAQTLISLRSVAAQVVTWADPRPIL